MGDDRVSFETLVAPFATAHQVAEGKWFGKPCLKTDDKAFVVLFGQNVAFKLTGEAHREALQIEGARLFDPRGKGNAFKEWVQVPVEKSSTWPSLAKKAHAFVSDTAA